VYLTPTETIPSSNSFLDVVKTFFSCHKNVVLATRNIISDCKKKILNQKSYSCGKILKKYFIEKTLPWHQETFLCVCISKFGSGLPSLRSVSLHC